jgi:hypothetical protein
MEAKGWQDERLKVMVLQKDFRFLPQLKIT